MAFTLAPPSTLPPVILPVALINPVVLMLPACTSELAMRYAPVILPTAFINPFELTLAPNTLPATLKPDALEKVAVAVGVIAPDAVVNICMFVALLVSVNASAAVTSNRPVDALPNCNVPLLNPRPVN